MNLDRGSLVSREFQEYEQGRYKPVVADSIPFHLSKIRKLLKKITKNQTKELLVAKNTAKLVQRIYLYIVHRHLKQSI